MRPDKLNVPSGFGRVRSLPSGRWPSSDQRAWAVACLPAERLKRGGAASHMREVTRRDLARRYGYFLDHIERTDGLDPQASPAGYVSPDRVDRFLSELRFRVGSVTVHGSIYKLRRMAQLLDPCCDFSWLIEIEKDLEFLMRPKSKFDRLVYTNILADAGIKQMAEAGALTDRPALARARQYRNGLMVALLALHFIRLKNFAALEIGRTLEQINKTGGSCFRHLRRRKNGRTSGSLTHVCCHGWSGISEFIDQFSPERNLHRRPCGCLQMTAAR